MRADLPARWLDDWRAAYAADPWGPERGDRRMARIVWAVLIGKTKKPPRESDFLFDFKPRRRVLSQDELQRKIDRMMVGHGGGPSLAAAFGGKAESGDC